MPFLLAEILNFQGSTHLIGVGSLSNKIKVVKMHPLPIEAVMTQKIMKSRIPLVSNVE